MTLTREQVEQFRRLINVTNEHVNLADSRYFGIESALAAMIDTDAVLRTELAAVRAKLEMLIREAQNVADDHHRPRYTRLDEALASAREMLS